MNSIKDSLLEQAQRMGISQEDIQKYKTGKKKGDIFLHGADLITEGGFTILPNFILRNKTVSWKAKLVFAAIASYAFGKKSTAFPGQETISKDLGLSIKTVQRGIEELSEKDYILVVRRGQGKTNVYVVNVRSVKYVAK